MNKVSQGFNNAFAPQTLFVYGTYKEDGSPNFGLFSWATYCVGDQIRFVACIGRDKMTRVRIHETGVFSASIVSKKMIAGADFCGCNSGHDTDKSQILTSEPGVVLNVPIPKDSPWSYELKVINTLKTGEGDSEIFICEIANTLVDERLQSETIPFEEKLEIASPVISVNWTYLKVEGENLGGWGSWNQTFK